MTKLMKMPLTALLSLITVIGLSNAAQAQQVQITGPTSPIVEGNTTNGSTANFQVSLASSSSVAQTVTVSTANGTAIAGQDYQSTTQQIQFPVGRTGPVTVSVPIIGDTSYEAGTNGDRLESFVVTATSNVNNSNGSANSAQASASIQDDDNLPTISIADRSNVEGSSNNANFTVSLSQTSSEPTTFTYTTSNGSATGGNAPGNGVDYKQTTGTLTIAPNQKEISAPVTIYDDSTDEVDETFNVTISNVQGATFANAGDDVATETITDDDGPNVSINDVSVNESNNTATFTVTLSAQSPQTISINYQTVDSTAKAGFDYTNSSGMLTFFPNETTKTFDVPIVDDFVYEGGTNETFTANLSGASGGVQIIDGQGIATIIDNETQPVITVSPASIMEGQGGSVALNFTATINGTSIQNISFRYATSDNTAVAGNDYTSTNGTATIPAGQSSTIITVQVLGDTIDESNETFRLNLSNPVNATLSPTSVLGTILDDDGPTISFVNTAVAVNEGDSNTSTEAVFTVHLKNASPDDVTVDYATKDGTATSGTNGDYTAKTGTLTFPANSSADQQIRVPIIGDDADEKDEDFTVTLSNPTNATIALGQATGTITDDDNPPAVSINSVSRTEGDTGNTLFTFTVSLSAISNQLVTVNYSVSDGTATVADNDFVADPGGTLTFNPGENTKQVTVNVLGDVNSEGDETFAVKLNAPTNATLGTSSGVGTIKNDDSPTPTVNINSVSANEGDTGTSDLTFTISLSGSSGLPVTVVYKVSDGTATLADGDYVKNDGATVTFAPGETTKTVVVKANGDVFNEDDENFTVDLSAPTNAILGNATGIGTITNDDAKPAISIDGDKSVDEGAAKATTPVTFNVTLNNPSKLQVKVDYTTNDGTAKATDSDYVGNNGTLIFLPGETAKTIVVNVTGDDINEPDETFTVALSNPTNATLSNALPKKVTGTIKNDEAVGSVTIAAPNADNTAIEGSRNAVFPVTLSGKASRDAVITYSVQSVGAKPTTSDNDFNTTFGTVTISAGTTTTNIVVIPISNDLDEPLIENYRVVLTGVTPAGTTLADGGFTIPADKSSASSTITDGDPGFSNYTPKFGFPDFNNNKGGIVNGTDVVISGNQFLIDGNSTIKEIRFGVGGSKPFTAVPASNANITDNEITVRVPQGARSGNIVLITNNNRTLSFPTTNQPAPGYFVVKPTITTFSPTFGVARVTQITINGSDFEDTLNPIKSVEFNGATYVLKDADRISDTQITATVPTDAKTGTLKILASFGGVGPDSIDTFTVSSTNPGKLLTTVSRSSIVENETGTIQNPISTFTLSLTPATQNAEGNPDIAPRGPVTARISVVDTGVGQVSLPRIEAIAENGNAINYVGGAIEVTFPAGQLASQRIYLTRAGDDSEKPIFTNGFFQEQTGRSLTVTSAITVTKDAELYPTGSAGTITLNRQDLHGLDTDISTVLRTSEEQDGSNNRTSFRLNLRNINNQDIGNKRFSKDPQPLTASTDVSDRSGGPGTLNPDGTINTDAEPIADVLLPFFVNKPDEALIRYFVMVPDSTVSSGFRKVFPKNDAVFRPRIIINYATDPTRDEYYKYDHFVEAKGVDDNVIDGSQEYQIRLDLSNQNQNGNSTDTEYQNLDLITPFTLVNTDNEQVDNEVGGSDEPGFLFSGSTSADRDSVPHLSVKEPEQSDQKLGTQSSFTVRLRTAPSSGDGDIGDAIDGVVALTLESSEPSAILIIDPVTGKPVQKVTLYFTEKTENNPPANRSRWDRPQTVRVVAVNDDVLGNRDATLLTQTDNSKTTDPAYDTLDPFDPTVTVVDNESATVIIDPATVIVTEGERGSFGVRLNSQPTKNVTVSLSSSDEDIATVVTPSNGNLVFTPANWNKVQTVSFSTIPDATLSTTRTVTIVTSVTASSDPNYNNIDVPDVTVSVRDNGAGVVSIQAPTNAVAVEGGGKIVFSVVLSRRAISPLTVSYNVTGDGASPANPSADLSVLPSTGKVTIPAGRSSASIEVLAKADNFNEVSESFRIRLTGVSSKTTSISDTANSATGSVDDRTVRGVTVEPTTAIVTEGERGSFGVRLNSQPTKNVTVSLSSSDEDIATVVTPSNGNLVFTPANWNKVQTVSFSTIPDATLSTTRTVTIVTSVTASSDPNYNNIDVPDVTVSVRDNGAGVVSIQAPTNAVAVEGGGKIVFSVVLSRRAISPLTVSYNVTGDGASPANPSADLSVLPSTGKVTIPAGRSSASIEVLAKADNFNEVSESFRIRLTGVSSKTTSISDTANSATGSVDDRTAGFANFNVASGFATYNSNGVVVPGSIVVLSGDQFVIDGAPQIKEVRFGVTDGIKGTGGVSSPARDFISVAADQISVRVPAGSRSGLIRLVTTTNQVIAPSLGANSLFYVQPVVQSFSPETGVARIQVVTVKGVNFKDTRNKITAVRFNGVASTVDDAGASFKIVDDTTLTVTVPNGATTGHLSIETQNGGVGPNSTRNFVIGAKSVVVTPTSVTMNEGTTTTFTVALNGQPENDVIIDLSTTDATVASANPTSLVFTPSDFRTPKTVTVTAPRDGTFVAQRNTRIVLSNTSSQDPTFNNLDVADVVVAVKNAEAPFNISQPTNLRTNENGSAATVGVSLGSAPTSNVVLTLTSDNSNEAQLSVAGGIKSSSVQLTFTPMNYNVAQSVSVVGIDDNVADGNASFNITGRVETTSPNYAGQNFPTITGVNVDDDGVNNGEQITFAANGTYTVSFPYATSDGTLTQDQALSRVSGSGSSGFTLYKFNVTGQRNDRTQGGNDFVPLAAGEKLRRGIGYRLLTGDTDIRLNTPKNVAALKVFTGSTFTLNLNWNPNFLSETSAADNRFNGYNFIGFPFDPSKFNRVSFANAKVQYGNQTYESVTDAAAAGIMGQQLFTVDAQGNLSEASDNDLQLRPYRAYFVRIFRNDFPVVLTLRNPSS